EEAPQGERPAPPTPADAALRALSSELRGPGLIPEVAPVLSHAKADLWRWLRTNVRRQKQPGYSLATVTIPMGDLTGEQMRVLGDLARAYGDRTVRVSSEQDLLYRWVPHAEIPHLYSRLAAAGLGLPGANTISDVTSCPGAESCRLAVTQSRGLGKLLGDHLPRRPAFA